MSCFGRGLRRTAPARASSRNELVTPSTASLSRVNGWACPPHSFQLVGWTIYSYMAVVGFGIYIPLLPSPWSHMAYSLTGIAFIVHLVTHLAAVSIDPAEAGVRAKKSYSNPLPVFDKKKQPHVIHNLHCYLCKINVDPKVKHCGVCNKCIEDFDHHCKWLNNCVGGQNYWYFFVTVLSATLGVLVLLMVILFIFIQHYMDPASLRTAQQFTSVMSNGTRLVFLSVGVMSNGTWLVFLSVGVLSNGTWLVFLSVGVLSNGTWLVFLSVGVMSNGTWLVFLSVGVMSNGTWLVFLSVGVMSNGTWLVFLSVGVLSNGTWLVFLSVGVLSNGTWLVFLPLAPLETSSGSLLVVAFLTVMLATGSLLLLVHLLGFHIYLLLNKMSTYDYIITRRRGQASQQDIEMGFPQSSDSNGNAGQNHQQMEPPIDCDALLSDSVSCKNQETGTISSRLSGSFCTELDNFTKSSEKENGFYYGTELPTQIIPGEVVMDDPLGWRLGGGAEGPRAGQCEGGPLH
ncbi:palmitoyltransferase ZDHHC11 isoform X1 [Salvelinus fontinalis]|uniref:palmitoyltransferase ZDHHC11 isoform X1 n=1 Tax=Salvelinus fontinalis TaxID=8038 RepID=UPI0024851F8E|nr:palmitoyltransferase ZDHHC11 isoform X1 [Salvelinus fontinalis]